MSNPVVEIDLGKMEFDHSLEEAVIRIYGRVVDAIGVKSASRFAYACAFYNVKHGDIRLIESPLATDDVAHFFFQGELVAKWNFSGAFKEKIQ
jgi:hypothetical protein